MKNKKTAFEALCKQLLQTIICIFLMLGLISNGLANTPEFDKGLNWLQAQVKTDGELALPSKRADTLQSKCEVANTLLTLAGNNTNLVSLVQSMDAEKASATTEAIACKYYVESQFRQNGAGTVEGLKSRLIDSKSWAAFQGFQVGSELDSGWALLAYSNSNNASSINVLSEKTLKWLIGAQNSDGSFSTFGVTDVLTTAIILRSVNRYAAKNADAAQIAKKSAAYLLKEGAFQTLWANDAVLTAIAFEAVHPYTKKEKSLVKQVNQYLLEKQSNDGSWFGDPYVTAVVLRALHLASVEPKDPTRNSKLASVEGTITVMDSGTALPGARVVLTVSNNQKLERVTDGNGKFVFDDLEPETVELKVLKQGFVTVVATATLAPASKSTFSPAMRAEGTNPTIVGAKLSGRTVIVEKISKTPLEGVTITQSGAPSNFVTSVSTGMFALELPAGEVNIEYSKSGYQTLTQKLVLTDGSVVTVGDIEMLPIRVESNIRGVVTNLKGEPISNATVSIGSWSSRTNNSGAYSMSGLKGKQLQVKLEADGYVSKSYVLTIEQPSDVVKNFTLSKASESYLEIRAASLSKNRAGLDEVIKMSALVVNPSAGKAVSALMLEVKNSDGKVLNRISAVDASGTPIGLVSLDSNENSTAHFLWNTASYAPGQYKLVAKLIALNTITRKTPSGVATGSVNKNLEVIDSPRISGSLTATPPVIRSGTGQKMKISALLQNDGNVPLNEQTHTLTVVDKSSKETLYSKTVVVGAMPVSGLQEVLIGEWEPSKEGDLEVRLTPPDSTKGQITTSIYVGDSGTAQFTIDNQRVAPGDQKVRGTIRVQGHDVAGGNISDPLAPLIKKAVVKAVNYADNYAGNHYVNDLKCFACHVQSQAVVGGERNLRFAKPLKPLKRSALVNGMTQYLKDDGTILHGGSSWPVTNTSLAFWATTQWHDSKAVNLSNYKMANAVMQRQRSDGSWSPDHPGGWWRTRAPFSGMNVGALAKTKKQLEADNFASIPGFERLEVSGLPDGDMRLTAADDGTIYIAHHTSKSIYKISPDGKEAVQIEKNIPVTGVNWLPSGELLISARNGVYLRSINGSKTKITDTDTWDVKPYQDGYLLSPYGGAVIYKITSDGKREPFYSSGLLAKTSGSLIVNADNSFYVHSNSGRRVLHVGANGKLLRTPISITNGNPIEFIKYKGGALLGTDVGLFFFNKEWVAQRWSEARSFGFTELPNGELITHQSGKLYRVVDKPVDLNSFNKKVEASIGKSVAWVKAGRGIDMNNNIDVAFRLITLGKAKEHYKGTDKSNELDQLMSSLGKILRSRQRGDGGWVWRQGSYNNSDSMVTAIVGVALDYLNPSKDSPEVRKAVKLLLSRQQPDGTWRSENGVGRTRLMSSTWVEIWLPTMLDRLGGIDADLRVAFPSNVTLSNPDIQPDSQNQDGDSTSYLWKLTGVTSRGQDINFDLQLANMSIGEVRAVAEKAELVFKNSFSQGEVVSLIKVPNVEVDTGMKIKITTDKSVYRVTEPVLLKAPVSNTGLADRSAVVRFTILDGKNTSIAVLPLSARTLIPKGKTVNVDAVWSAAGTLSGDYQVLAELVATDGTVYGSAKAPFRIVAGVAVTNVANIRTDKVQYSAADMIQIKGFVRNQSSNVVQNNLTAIVTVTDTQGVVLYTRSQPVTQLAAGGIINSNHSLQASTLEAGKYTATIELKSDKEKVLAQSKAIFEVLSSSATGIGIKGEVAVSPKQVPATTAALINFKASNNGNADFNNLPLYVSIVDPENNKQLVKEPYKTNLAKTKSYSGKTTWTADVEPGTTLIAVLTAEVAGKTLTLAQDSFKVVAPPIKFAVQQKLSLPSGSNVLVLFDCKKNHILHPNKKDKLDLHELFHKHKCYKKRYELLQKTLTELGVKHTIVYKHHDFIEELRSGKYNHIWMLGAVPLLHHTVVGEVREAVNRGASLLLDGGFSVIGNHELIKLSGAHFAGRIWLKAPLMDIEADSSIYSQSTITTEVHPMRMINYHGTVQAKYDRKYFSHLDLDDLSIIKKHHPHYTYYAAVVSNSYGKGKVLVFGFDLLEALPNPQADLEKWRAFMKESMAYLKPKAQPHTGSYWPGQVITLNTAIQNQGVSTGAQFITTLPESNSYVDSTPDGTWDSNQKQAQWQINSVAKTTTPIQLRVRAPLTPGAYQLNSTLSSILNGKQRLYGDYFADLVVGDSQAQLDAAIAQLNQLKPFGLLDRIRIRLAQTYLQKAQRDIAYNRMEWAIAHTVKSTYFLKKVRTVDVNKPRLVIDQRIKELEYKWWLQNHSK